MEIILLERVEKLGAIGDVVRVKDGFARNYLLPNKKALRANEANRKLFEAQRAQGVDVLQQMFEREAAPLAEDLVPVDEPAAAPGGPAAEVLEAEAEAPTEEGEAEASAIEGEEQPEG